MVGLLLGVVLVLSLIRGTPLLEMIPLMPVLLMIAVPVALHVMLTVSMAVGSRDLTDVAKPRSFESWLVWSRLGVAHVHLIAGM